MNFFNYLESFSKPAILAAEIALVLLIGIVDYVTGFEISVVIFYLVPVFMAAWFSGKKTGIVISVLCAIVLHTADQMGGLTLSHPLIAYWNSLTLFGFFTLITLLVSQLRNSLNYEKTVARVDYLTGAVNSRAFYEIAVSEMRRSVRYNRPMTLSYLDIDNFKSVNDSFGHHVGDGVLRRVTETIKNNVRTSDICARLGGDEFIILLPETDYESARAVNKKIFDTLTEEMKKNDWPVSFSVGSITCSKPVCSVDEMIKCADSLMYSVKKSSKNGIRHEQFDRIKSCKIEGRIIA